MTLSLVNKVEEQSGGFMSRFVALFFFLIINLSLCCQYSNIYFNLWKTVSRTKTLPWTYCVFFLCLCYSAKVIVTLHPPPPNKEPGPCVSSPYACVKFSFKQGGHSEVHICKKAQYYSWKLFWLTVNWYAVWAWTWLLS